MKRTLLRHQMLHAVSVGQVTFSFVGTRDWEIKSSVSTYTQMARGVNWLLDRDLAEICLGSVQITPAGVSTLSEWDEKYGPVTR